MSDKKTKFDTELIRELAAIIKESDLGEIEIEDDDLRIRVSRHEPAPISIAAPIAAAPAAAAPVAATAPAAAAPVEAAAAIPENAVKSPMVGTVYLSPEPGAPAFIKEGDAVKEGQTLLLVEAMKTFNPLTAPASGRITRILVADSQPVEFGEPLVVIE